MRTVPTIMIIVLIAVGALTTFVPSVWWRLVESWKSNSEREPSALYLLWTRISGAVLLVVGIALGVWKFLL